MVASADVDDQGTSLLREGDTRGVVEVGQAVEELDAATLALELDDAFLQRLRDDTLSVDGDLLDVGLVRREDRQ